jgi:hypothetical protein
MKNGGFVCSARFQEKECREPVDIARNGSGMPKITETITTNLFAFLLIVMIHFKFEFLHL